MRQEESFVCFLKRTVITFWAFVTLSVMFLVTSVAIAYIATIAYNKLTNQEPIDTNNIRKD